MDKIYDRQNTDTDKSWLAFCKYRDMGCDRTLEKLRVQIGYRSGRKLEQWSSQYAWVARCRAFDDDELRSQSVALQQQRINYKLQIEKEAWEKRKKFLKKADQILSIPITQKIVTDDGKTIFMPTNKWRLVDAIAFDEYAHKLGIFATGGDRPNMTEFDAIRVLVMAGMLPVEILEACERGIDNLKLSLREAFANLNNPVY
jgi:hypothetical protein